MLIYKFGGSSLGDAEGIRNITDIVKEAPENLVVVISALGKTTNALERVVKHHLDGNLTEAGKEIETIRQFHQTIISDLFGSTDNEVGNEKFHNITIAESA
jgi:aspartate kinase